MTITALPTAPARSQSSDVFVANADAFIGALATFVTEANAVAVAMNLNSTNGTSASSVAIGLGAKTFTVASGKSWQPGMFLVIADTAAPSTNSMYGQVTSYSGTSLVMNVLSVLGSGTKTAWTISQTSAANMDVDTATTATNVAGGLGGSVPYQSGAGVTVMLANGTAGQLLQANGTTLAPTWVAATAFASGAENIAGTIQNKAVDPLGIREAFNATGIAPVYACRAWVNFDGTGTVAIRASGNVSSITDNGVGDYTVNFTTAMQDANYSIGGDLRHPSGFISPMLAVTVVAGSLRVQSKDNGGIPLDVSECAVQIFR